MPFVLLIIALIVCIATFGFWNTFLGVLGVCVLLPLIVALVLGVICGIMFLFAYLLGELD